MARDKVVPIKIESTALGGDENDEFPIPADVHEDFLECRGLCIQNATSRDDGVGVERDSSDNLTLFDSVAGSKTLDQLPTSDQHKALRQLIHLADGGGPYEGFTSGAYRETTGTVFPTAIVWYDKAGEGKKKIVEKLISWSGAFPSQIQWKAYDASETLLATVTDTISWSGPFESSRTRAIS